MRARRGSPTWERLLIQAAIQASIPVISLPGPCAAITALVGSGLPTDRLFFIGFLPRRRGAGQTGPGSGSCRRKPPSRFMNRLTGPCGNASEWIEELAGPETPVVIARELTKVHEEFLRGTARMVRERLEAVPPLGEKLAILFETEEKEPT